MLTTAPTRSIVPDPATTARLAASHEAVPLTLEMPAGSLTPLTAYARLNPPGTTGFLLESASATGRPAGRSYVGHRPRPVRLAPGDPLTSLEPLLHRRVARVPGQDVLPAFHGGAVGYLGFEAAGHFERLPAPAPAGPPLPESAFLHADDLAVFDHDSGMVTLATLYRPGRESQAAALDRLGRMRELLTRPGGPVEPPLVPGRRSPRPDPSGWEANMTRDRFEENVRRAKEYILAGDIFQVVLSQRFRRRVRAQPLNVYRQLRAVNPSPYMFQLALGGERYVIGASPELLVRTEGRTVRTRPLAGTRPRGTGPQDAALERELLADEKERAEHVMLVDLGRNDIGRVSAPGTVRVERLMEVERYSHVMHLSSTVCGELAEDRTCLDAMRAAFPAGTVSGAPKIRAMEIIAELEPERRGVYGGALGYLGTDGSLDTAIALRTLVMARGHAYVQAGAGIVADSDPAAEYRETLHKAGALFEAVARAEGTW
ncbi:anthranilate synthase component I [Streptomyces sp. PRKS01-65]|nr:anthranilate synthase component I family protein [Streptomyces harenosi]NEY35725.1 anthranilate synthase component I [Streptomyces harenosi]